MKHVFKPVLKNQPVELSRQVSWLNNMNEYKTFTGETSQRLSVIKNYRKINKKIRSQFLKKSEKKKDEDGYTEDSDEAERKQKAEQEHLMHVLY